jgi:DNA invertase Pin-like site-specific DNA recombinase
MGQGASLEARRQLPNVQGREGLTRAVILARVSRGERTQDPTSQLESLRAVAARQGWTVAAEVVKVCSAWDAKTSQDVQTAALAPIVAGQADVLMVWSLDRLVRGGAERAFTLVGLLEKHHGAALYSLQEPFLSTATSDPATRELLLPIIAWVGKWESQRKSDRLTAKAGSKRVAAEKLGQRALWGRGYMATDDDKRRVHDLRLQTPRLSMKAIAALVGLSVGSVHRILQSDAPTVAGISNPKIEGPGSGQAALADKGEVASGGSKA